MRRDKSKQLLPVHPDAERAADMEIAHHMEEAAERLVASGWSPEDARAEAARRFGSIARVRGSMVRETRTIERKATFWDFLTSIPADMRYAWRGLRRNALFTVIVVATLGLGMGAAATVFTVVDALLLRPLPYAEPTRLVDLSVMEAGDEKISMPLLSADRVRQLEADSTVFSQFAYYDQRGYTLTGESEALELAGLMVSSRMDELLGFRAHVGRAFDDADMQPGAHRAMLSYDFWRKRGGERGAIGSTIRLNGTPYEVIGVLPRNLKYPVHGRAAQVWTALPSDLVVDGAPLPYVLGSARLSDDVTLESAQSRLATLAVPAGAQGPFALPLHIAPMGEWRGNPDLVRGVWLIAGAIALMLLVSMVNAMNLILFRGADRVRELAVRLALGVSRMQLMRHILVENVVIALLSGAAAVVVAVAGVAAVNERLPEDFAFSSAYAFQLSGRVLLFTFVMACVVGLLLGVLPLIRALRLQFVAGQLTVARGVTMSDALIARVLVVTEVAFAVALLTGAGLLAASFDRMTRVDPGLDTDHLALLSVNLPPRYDSPERRAQFLQRLESELEARPEIEGATVSVGAPPNVSFSFDVALQAEGGEPLPVAKGEAGLLPFISATPDFVKTTGMSIVAGRDLTAADVGTRNVLVDSRMAEALWGSPIAGRRFRTDAESEWLTVAGVYRHLHAMGLDDRESQFGMIRPRNPAKAGPYMSVIVRPRGEPAAALPIIRDVLRSLDPDVPASRLQTASEAFSETVDKPRFLARVMSGVSLSALVLAAVGIYGVLSYSVARRRREMGIRMAIGAAPARLGWLFLREGLMLSVAGVVIGLVLGYWLVGFTRVLLYGLAPTDPLAYAGAALLVIVVACVASVVPARAAGSMSPASVLRSE